MLERLCSHPGDRLGTHIDSSLELWSGWVGREGEQVAQPAWNAEKDICLLFSGEHFADNPEGAGSKYGVSALDLYLKRGMGFLEELNGLFSGLLIDRRERRVVLFNDRFGINRVYFYEGEDAFYFSSEAKALLKILASTRRFDLRGLGEFLVCGCVMQNRTLFSGISLLPPASAWTFGTGLPPKKQSYFKSETWEQQGTLPASEFHERLQETWKRVLPRYLRGQDGVALSLTGGVDSRMILAWAACAPGTLPCITFGGKYRDCGDVRVARKLARICQQPCEIITIDSPFLAEFPSLAESAIYLSDGAMDVTGSIDLYVQRKARKIAPVRLTGTNGGEVLRRLVAFNPARFPHSFLDAEVSSSVRQAVATYADELRGHKLSFTAFKQAPWYLGSKFVLERSEIRLRMPYCDNDLVALSYRAPPVLAESNEPALRLIAEGNPALSRIQTDRGLVAKPIAGVTRLVRFYQEFTFKAEYAYDYGMPQWLAKLDHAFAPLHLERLFLGRHKFHHFRVFYRDELADYVKAMLLDPRTRGRPYLHSAALESMVNGHVRGNRNHTVEIHKLLTLELIQRQLLEQN